MHDSEDDLLDTVVHINEAFRVMHDLVGKTHRRGYIITGWFERCDSQPDFARLWLGETRATTHSIRLDKDGQPSSEYHQLYQSVDMARVWCIPMVN